MRGLWMAVVVGLALAGAASAEEQPWGIISDTLRPVALATPVALMLTGNDYDRETGRRVFDAVLMGVAAERLGKHTVTDPRPAPYADDLHGWPSGHSIAAMAVAEVVAQREPHLKYWAYGYAGLVGYSRIALDRHDTTQVLSGLALGYLFGHQAGTGRWHILGHPDSALGFAAEPRQGLGLAYESGPTVRWDWSF